MSTSDSGTLMVVGTDVGAMASSAKRAGYEVVSVDFFGDIDLRASSVESLAIVEQRTNLLTPRFAESFRPEALLELSRKLVDKIHVDGMILSSGFEDHPNLMSELAKLAPIVGNSPEKVARARDKAGFFDELRRLGIPHPETALVSDLREARRIAANLGYPVVIKPTGGFGGVGSELVHSRDRIESSFEKVRSSSEEVMIQEYISGTSISASVISTGNRSKALTINEQILGKKEFGMTHRFGYCGNMVPYTSEYEDACRSTAERVVSHFGLIGSNGVDVVLSEGKPYVIEVNPRFQGTLECVERVLGINLVKTHIDACTFRLIPERTMHRCYSTRVILYAPYRCTAPDLSDLKYVRDIPFPGSIVEEGEPLCSIVVDGIEIGSTRENAEQSIRDIKSRILSTGQPNSTTIG